MAVGPPHTVVARRGAISPGGAFYLCCSPEEEKAACAGLELPRDSTAEGCKSSPTPSLDAKVLGSPEGVG